MFSNNAVIPLITKNQQTKTKEERKRHLGKVIMFEVSLVSNHITSLPMHIKSLLVINIHGAHQAYDRVITPVKMFPSGLPQHSLKLLRLCRLERTLTKLNKFPKKTQKST